MRTNRLLPWLFGATLFLSACLLFSVQPMIAKMLLPFLGGTPAVWNTCLVFFQTVLLAGYAYAHLTTTRLTPTAQARLHVTLLFVAALALPFQVSDSAIATLPTESNPSLWLLGRLLTVVGLPFFVVSTSAPLLQRWFANTRHSSASDPYFLYAASNLGSLIALASYPFFLEPHLRLREQSAFWTIGYAALAVMICLCLAAQWRAQNSRRLERHAMTAPVGCNDVLDPASPEGVPPVRPAGSGPQLRRRFRWVAYAFVPSSLMLGITTYLTADIASIPLLWVLPLSLYLLSFILVFAKKKFIAPRFWERALPIAAVGLIYLLLSEATDPTWLLISLHLLFFFIAAMVCHGRLVAERPSPRYLTEFYLWISVGGVLGGLFNALVAPMLFNRVLEYPLVILFACLLRTSAARSARENPTKAPAASLGAIAAVGSVAQFTSGLSGAGAESVDAPNAFGALRARDFVFPMGIGLVALVLAKFAPDLTSAPFQLRLGLAFGLPAVLSYTLVDRPVRFALALGAVMLASSFYSGSHGRTLRAERNFFGVLRVTLDPSGRFHRLVHGNTVHGRQFIDPTRQCEPLSYYHRTGPLGQIFASFDAKPAATNIAVVGLGAGSMVCYAKPHQRWTYYEINSAVLRLARDTNYFTFLNPCAGAPVGIVLGDARLRLREARARAYDLIILDAFSSDAIPVHLITRQALDLYLSKLAAGGMLVFHISNRNLDLQPVLNALAGHARLTCLVQDENDPSPQEAADGKDPSTWVVMAERREDLGRLPKDSRWLPGTAPSNAKVWTDDFSNLWTVFRWN